MKPRYGRSAGGKGKKAGPAACALAMGLSLAFPGSGALASDNPIPGVDIIVQKNPNPPGPISVVLPDPSGNFSLRLTERGNYTISTACRLPGGCAPHKLSGSTLKPGAEGDGPGIIGILIGLLLPAQKSSAEDMTFDFTVGERGVVLNGQFQDAAGVRIRVSADVPTLRVQGTTAPGTDGGDAKHPRELRVINNSETDTATVDASTPTSGIGGTGGGRYTFIPSLGTSTQAADLANAGSSNRDHIDQDAQIDISKRTAVQTGGPGTGVNPTPSQPEARPIATITISVSAVNDAPGIQSGPIPDTQVGRGGGDIKPGIGLNFEEVKVPYDSTARTPNVADDKLPGLATDPIPGVEVRPGATVTITVNAVNDAPSLRAAPGPEGGDGKLPGLAGEPIAGVEVRLGKNPGGSNVPTATISQSGVVIAAEILASARTDSQGNFYFDKVPAGNYQLTLPGLPAQSLTVGADGIAGGTVMKNPDGSMRIFDRWGNRMAASPTGGDGKPGIANGATFPKVEIKRAPVAAGKPVGFGSGNTIGAGPGMGGPVLPGGLPGLGPMGPGAGPGMGPMGPGGAMGRPGAGRP